MKFITQTNVGEIHFLSDIFYHMDHTLKKRKKRLSHLRFARPTSYGWSFFYGNAAWEVLEDIAGKVVKLHEKCCSKSKIIDVISELVNLPEQELTNLRIASL